MKKIIIILVTIIPMLSKGQLSMIDLLNEIPPPSEKPTIIILSFPRCGFGEHYDSLGHVSYAPIGSFYRKDTVISRKSVHVGDTTHPVIHQSAKEDFAPKPVEREIITIIENPALTKSSLLAEWESAPQKTKVEYTWRYYKWKWLFRKKSYFQ